MKEIRKILIANRGEIAVRIIRSAKQLGIDTVAVYSLADADSLAVRMADEAYPLSGNELSDTYLNIEKIVEIARQSESDAIHPGYGFLAENTLFAQACQESNIVFIGPHSEAIQLMGNKIEARRFVEQLNVPLTKAATGGPEQLLNASRDIPFPLLVKAAAGGGGKGMRIVHHKDELQEAIESTSREAKAYFGDGEVFIEQYIEEPRHIEVQVLGDKHGNVIHLYERECSIQRRYQKIIEESPSPTLTQEVRERMCATTVSIAQAVKYDNAGTMEFLVDKNLNYYFLEMNTRIQVEHPVTEMVTRTDLVKEQIRIAAGHPLGLKQEDIKQAGHAIEARIYAEKPEEDFRPAPGEINYLHQASGAGIRLDTALDKAGTIHSFYDPMISKLIAFGDKRDVARKRLLKALNSTSIIGIDTNIEYLYAMLNAEAFINNKVSTKFCDERSHEIFAWIHEQKEKLSKAKIAIAYALYDLNSLNTDKESVWSALGYWRQLPILSIEVDGEPIELIITGKHKKEYRIECSDQNYKASLQEAGQHHIRLDIDGETHFFTVVKQKSGHHYIQYGVHQYRTSRFDELIQQDVFEAQAGTSDSLSAHAPMPGKIIKVNVKVGDHVAEGDELLVVEAMKMENSVRAGNGGTVEEVNTAVGEMVDPDKILVQLKQVE